MFEHKIIIIRGYKTTNTANYGRPTIEQRTTIGRLYSALNYRDDRLLARQRGVAVIARDML